jgi:hypothetical protein
MPNQAFIDSKKIPRPGRPIIDFDRRYSAREYLNLLYIAEYLPEYRVIAIYIREHAISFDFTRAQRNYMLTIPNIKPIDLTPDILIAHMIEDGMPFT